MTLQASGAISLSQVQTEFGGSNPISMNEYYAGGANVPSGTSGTNGAVPTSGTISASQFYGTSNITVASWNAYVDATATATFIGGQNIEDASSGLWVKVDSGIAKFGTLLGSPFGTTAIVGGTSEFRRLVQHMVEVEADMDYIIANGVKVLFRRIGLLSGTQTTEAVTRNGVTSLGQTYAGFFIVPSSGHSISMRWFDGTKAYERIHGGARTEISI